MSGSHRGFFIVATVVAVITLGTFTAAESRCQREQDAYRSAHSGEDSQPDITNFRTDRAWLPCLVERAAANPEAPEAAEKDQRDLIAQESSALWAFWIATFGLLQLLTTIIGLILVKRTLDATWKAVEDTGTATEAMLAANEIAREAGAKAARVAGEQLRPYLSIDDVATSIRVRPDSVEGGFRVEVDMSFAVENSGQTIASNVRIWFECSPMNLGSKTADWQIANINHVFPTHIAPGSVFKHRSGGGCHVPEEKSHNPIYFSLCVAYESSFTVGPRQTCQEYIGYREMFGGSAGTHDLAEVASAGEPVTLLMRRSGMFSRMT